MTGGTPTPGPRSTSPGSAGCRSSRRPAAGPPAPSYTGVAPDQATAEGPWAPPRVPTTATTTTAPPAPASDAPEAPPTDLPSRRRRRRRGLDPPAPCWRCSAPPAASCGGGRVPAPERSVADGGAGPRTPRQVTWPGSSPRRRSRWSTWTPPEAETPTEFARRASAGAGAAAPPTRDLAAATAAAGPGLDRRRRGGRPAAASAIVRAGPRGWPGPGAGRGPRPHRAGNARIAEASYWSSRRKRSRMRWLVAPK